MAMITSARPGEAGAWRSALLTRNKHAQGHTVVAMPEIHAARRAGAREKVAAHGADAALITSPANVRYLTGLVSSNAALLLPADGPEVLATDSRYAAAAERDCPDVELVVERFIELALATLAAARGLRTVAFEAQEMTVERHQALADTGGPDLIPLGRAIEELRMVKDEAEISLLALACAITSEACSDALASVRPGITEREFAVLLERSMIDRSLACRVVGSPDVVRRGLAEFVGRTGPDEVMITANIFDHAARLHSFEIAAMAAGALDQSFAARAAVR